MNDYAKDTEVLLEKKESQPFEDTTYLDNIDFNTNKDSRGKIKVFIDCSFCNIDDLKQIFYL